MLSINGVSTIPLKKVTNDRGHLMEVQREDDPQYPGFGQAYITCTPPGVVKAWYRHHKQVDQIALVKGELVIALYDARKDSKTCNNLMEINNSEQSPLLIQIPPGVWHGFKSVGNEAAYLLHLNSVAFDFEHTDEDRLPIDSPLIPYEW
jgi:dTDP-4-dehydrorhamnose 3,5-epimerase